MLNPEVDARPPRNLDEKSNPGVQFTTLVGGTLSKHGGGVEKGIQDGKAGLNIQSRTIPMGSRTWIRPTKSLSLELLLPDRLDRSPFMTDKKWGPIQEKSQSSSL
jgi:hypothetical protein